MMNTEKIASPFSAAKIALIFTAVFVGLYILITIISMVVMALWNFEFHNSAMGLIIVFCAGSAAGQAWYGRELQTPASSRVWKISALCTVVTIFVQAGALWLVTLLDGWERGTQSGLEGLEIGNFHSQDLMILLAVGVVVSLLVLLLIRFSFSVGFKQKRKQIEMLAAKAANKNA